MRLLHNAKSATIHLELAAMSFQSDEGMVDANQLARAGTCGKIPVDPNLHSWCMPILQGLGQRHDRGYGSRVSLVEALL